MPPMPAASPGSSTPRRCPRHVGVMLDGNRRWAKARGAGTSEGHQAGADNIANLLSLVRRGRRRGGHPVAAVDRQPQPPREGAAAAAGDHRDAPSTRSPRRTAGASTPSGPSTCCPSRTAARLKAAEDHTRDVDGMLVNVAVGYGGRREIADAVRSLLQEHATRGTSIEELAEVIDVEHIAEHLYTKGQPDPDLVIRTSGEQRLGGLPALAERAQRVLLLRGLLARLPQGRLPAGAARLRRAAPPLRLLSRPPASGRRRRGRMP